MVRVPVPSERQADETSHGSFNLTPYLKSSAWAVPRDGDHVPARIQLSCFGRHPNIQIQRHRSQATLVVLGTSTHLINKEPLRHSCLRHPRAGNK